VGRFKPFCKESTNNLKANKQAKTRIILNNLQINADKAIVTVQIRVQEYIGICEN